MKIVLPFLFFSIKKILLTFTESLLTFETLLLMFSCPGEVFLYAIQLQEALEDLLKLVRDVFMQVCSLLLLYFAVLLLRQSLLIIDIKVVVIWKLLYQIGAAFAVSVSIYYVPVYVWRAGVSKGVVNAVGPYISPGCCGSSRCQ